MFLKLFGVWFTSFCYNSSNVLSFWLQHHQRSNIISSHLHQHKKSPQSSEITFQAFGNVNWTELATFCTASMAVSLARQDSQGEPILPSPLLETISATEMFSRPFNIEDEAPKSDPSKSFSTWFVSLLHECCEIAIFSVSCHDRTALTIPCILDWDGNVTGRSVDDEGYVVPWWFEVE